MSEVLNYRNSNMYKRAMALNGRPQSEKTVSLLNLAREHEPSLYKHKVSRITLSIGLSNRDNLSNSELDLLFYGGLLHDIGKIAVDREILLRNRRLTSQEDSLLRAHGKIGEEMLLGIGYDPIYGMIADQHYIGSDFEITTQEDLNRRHKLVPYVSLADFLVSLLDRDRLYQKHYTLDEVMEGVERRFVAGYFPVELKPHFYKALEQNRDLLI